MTLRVLSLGAGVQSTTLALMAARGDIERPDCAIFADTGWEPAAVYRHLAWLETQLPYPVHHVTAGNIRPPGGVISERRKTMAETTFRPGMMCYASRTGTRRNLAALRAAGWGLLISRSGAWRTEGFENYVLDNGAWTDFQANRPFNEDAFERMIDLLGAKAQWIVLPDIVAGGLASLELSLRWSNRCLSACPMVLIAVQDGMTVADISPFVGPSVGLFLGGSTEWKISQMGLWGAFCRQREIHYHVARVNTEKRMAMAVAAGADSIDGSSASRYAVTLPKLARAARQQDLWTPERAA